ncbi:MAG: DUF305 domain-containing protein [Oceanicaulis sp.]
MPSSFLARAGLSGAALFFAAPAFATPPIQNPGAPGQAGRTLTAEQSVEMAASSYIPADAQFMRHMIVHHDQAVEMNALIAERTGNREIVLLGRRIAMTQEAEMALMERWLKARGEPVEADDLHAGHGTHGDHSAHGGHDAHAMHGDHADHADHSDHGAHAPDPGDVPLMPGMLSPNQMAALRAAEGGEFDRLFLEGMIVHHQGAIDMVEALLARPGAAQDTTLSEFLSHVVADQSAEILRMRVMLDAMEDGHGHHGEHHHD